MKDKILYTILLLIFVAIATGIYIHKNSGGCEEGYFCIVPEDSWRLKHKLAIKSVKGFSSIETLSASLKLDSDRKEISLTAKSYNDDSWGDSIETLAISNDTSHIEIGIVVDIPNLNNEINAKGIISYAGIVKYPFLIEYSAYDERQSEFDFTAKVQLTENKKPANIWTIVFWIFVVITGFVFLAFIGTFLPEPDESDNS